MLRSGQVEDECAARPQRAVDVREKSIAPHIVEHAEVEVDHQRGVEVRPHVERSVIGDGVRDRQIRGRGPLARHGDRSGGEIDPGDAKPATGEAFTVQPWTAAKVEHARPGPEAQPIRDPGDLALDRRVAA